MEDQLTPTEFIRAAERARPSNEAGFTGHRAAFHLMIARAELRKAKRASQKANRRVPNGRRSWPCWLTWLASGKPAEAHRAAFDSWDPGGRELGL